MSKSIQNFYKSTLSLDWSIGTGIFYVTTKPTISDGWLVISPNNATIREIVKYTSTGTDSNGDYIVISVRGVGGTTEQTHSIGEPIRMNITAEYWQDMNDAIDSIVAAGAPNAATDTKGIVEIATDAEVIAGTDTGTTGAKLVATPGQIKTNYEKIVPIVRTYLNAVSPATWTKPVGLKYIEVEVQAGGAGGVPTITGGGGGERNTAGGGAGGYSKKQILAANLGTTETVTIGAGGASNNNGGNSSFGTHATTNGGVSGGAGGTAASGDINIPGEAAFYPYATFKPGAHGGSSVLGTGGYGISLAGGTTGLGFGGGGGGANNTGGAEGTAGGAGAPGIVIIKEFY